MIKKTATDLMTPFRDWNDCMMEYDKMCSEAMAILHG